MAALVGKRVARVTGVRGTIKLSESDVPGSTEFRRWSIRAPHACLGAAMGRRQRTGRGRAVFLLAWARVECRNSVGSGEAHLFLATREQ